MTCGMRNMTRKRGVRCTSLLPGEAEAKQNDMRVALVTRLDRRRCLESGIHAALSQSWVLEGKSENRISENQWLASVNFPVFGSLRQSRNAYILLNPP